MDSYYEYKLAISITTKNRREVIEEVLERLLKALFDRNIGLYLFDGSDQDDLKTVVEEWQQHGFDNLHYKYYSPQIYKDDIERIVASRQIEDAQYVWLCSDKFLPQKNCLNTVLNELDKGYDVIVYNAMHWKGDSTKEYHDCVTFFKECAPKLQMLSEPIIGRRVIDFYTIENLRKADKECKYHDIELIFRNIIQLKEFAAKRLCIQSPQGMLISLQTGSDIDSSHVVSKKTLWYFVEQVYNTVTELPEIYQKEKETVMKTFSCYTWFSIEGFLRLKWKKGYDYQQCLQYWDKWKFVTKVPRIIVLLISILPSTIARILYKRVRRLKRALGMQYF